MIAIRTANLRLARRRIGRVVFGLLVTLSLMLAFAAPKLLAAQVPYEPNDAIPSAAGPLIIDQTYVAGLEISGDRDFFYFYVTSARPSQVILTVKNLGGGTSGSNINATIMDAFETPVGAYAYSVSQGESGIATATLAPQKYFVEVVSNEGVGDAYSLTGSGVGAFGSYAQIAARCTTAKAAVKAAQSGLKRAEAELQRATARLRGARYGTPHARQTARAVYQRAKARETAKRHALGVARKSRKPLCSIPQ